MTREDSKMMQGVAILIMIFYHLFNPGLVEGYDGTFIGNAARAANPVSFYVILSGYGFYINPQTGGKKFLSRCLKLYIPYWAITFSFMMISLWLDKGLWKFSTISVVENVTGWKTTYYPAAWFMLPYCILALMGRCLSRVLDYLGEVNTLLVFFAVYMFASWMNHNCDFFRANIFQSLYLLFPFMLGAAMAKANVVNKAKVLFTKYSEILPLVLIAILMVIRYFAYTGAVASFFAATFIVLFTCCRKALWVKGFFTALGKVSLGMWMCHLWICWHLFKDVIYGLDNPLLIFAATTLSSYALAAFFQRLMHPLLMKI